MRNTALVSMETTNSVYNTSLYNATTPQTALSWQRVIIANAWAYSGAEWTELMAMHNSGTYNNQWMVVTAAAFTPGHAPKPGFLWIIEQIPGYTQAADVTSVMVAQGYWPSYNIPYFPEVYNMSGYPAKAAQYGPQYTYAGASRAQIFKRNATAVTDLPSLFALLRYNNYANDPLAGGDPILGAISSRGDLRSPGPVAFGGVDTKVTAIGDLPKLVVYSQSGPTNLQQPTFAWANFPTFANVQHTLVPASFNFDILLTSLE